MEALHHRKSGYHHWTREEVFELLARLRAGQKVRQLAADTGYTVSRILQLLAEARSFERAERTARKIKEERANAD